jgi:DNA-binding transcriptional LysR family regulator
MMPDGRSLEARRVPAAQSRQAGPAPRLDAHGLGLVSTRMHYFQLVARLGSIRRTAEMLHVAPSSISRVIAQLEDDLGTPLFERIRQRLKLTSAGELLVHHGRSSVDELVRACVEIDDLRGLRRGTVSVAVVESVARGLLPKVLAAFWGRYPDIAVVTKVVGSQQAFDAVADGDCDIAVAFDVRTPRAAERIAGAVLGMGALVRPDHRCAGLKQARLTDFVGERLLMSDASLSLGPSVEEAITRSFADFRRRALTNSIGLMIDLAARGQGVAFQTRVGAEREIAGGALVFVPIRDVQLKPRKLLLISRAKAHMSESAALVAKALARMIEGLEVN